MKASRAQAIYEDHSGQGLVSAATGISMEAKAHLFSRNEHLKWNPLKEMWSPHKNSKKIFTLFVLVIPFEDTLFFKSHLRTRSKFYSWSSLSCHAAAAAAKWLQSWPTLCDPIDGSPPGCPIPGILQARTLEWVASSFSNAWKWKVKGKSLSQVWLLATPWTVAYQAPLSMRILQARALEWGASAFSASCHKSKQIATIQMPKN